MFGPDLYSEEEEASTRGQGFKLLPRFWPYLRRYLGRTGIAGLLLLASGLLSLVGPLVIKHAFDVELPKADATGLIKLALVYLVIQALVGVFTYLQQYLLEYVGENAISDLKSDLFRHILRLPVAFFDQNPVGRLLTRIESDARALQQMFATTAVAMLRSIIMLVGMSVVMCSVNWRLYLAIVGLFPLVLVGFYFLQRRMRPLVVRIRRTVAEINNFLAETLRSLPVVQAFNRQDYFAQRMDELSRKQLGQERAENWLWFWLWLIWDFGEMTGVSLVLILGGLWALKGGITVGGLFLFYSYISRFFMPIRNLSQQLNLMQRALASAERMLGILATAPEPSGGPGALTVRFSRELRFEDVDFSYANREPVLHQVNLSIARGEKVALVGETGGGKTSIANLVLKFYEPESGQVLIDGNDLRLVSTESLRGQIALVPQEVILFPGTILDNLRLFDESRTETQVHDAARRARIHERILQFPSGYATNLIERGINLSLGERQLLAFARALVFDPQILILDEATSSVDPHTEHLIQEGMQELLRGRTALIIAHRLATIRLVDRIVVVHQGRIVQTGSHDELLAQPGYYQRLYRMQYLGSEVGA